MTETVNTSFDSDRAEYECTSTLTNEGKVSEKVKKTELKPCPFCGGKAELKKTKIYYDDAVQIHCTECNVHTVALPFNCQMYFDGKNGYMTEEMAIERTAKKWNRRADNEQREAD